MGLLSFLRKDRTQAPGTENKAWMSMPMFDWSNNWFQQGKEAPVGNQALQSTAIYACTSILAQEVARLRVNHTQLDANSAKTIVTGSAPAMVMRKPNRYQTRSDLFLAIMQSVLLDGNSYTVAQRDARGAISSIVPLQPRSVLPYVVPDSGEVFYQVSGDNDNDITGLPPGYYIPARDMMHIRVFTSYSPLVGITPLSSCAASTSLGLEIQGQSASFFGNQSRPAGILSTPKPLGLEAAKRLREAWERGLAGKFVGKTAVLDNEIKWQPLALSAVDSQIVEQYKMSVDDIAMVYRIPPYMLGNLQNTAFSNVQGMQKQFIASTLGFWLEHIENALDALFGLSGDQGMEFDIERGLMRPDIESRMNALAKGVQGGIYAPNEARLKENLKPIEGGDEAFLQRQMTPVSLLSELAALDVANPASNDPAPAAEPADEDEGEDEDMKSLRLIVNKKLDRKLA